MDVYLLKMVFYVYGCGKYRSFNSLLFINTVNIYITCIIMKINEIVDTEFRDSQNTQNTVSKLKNTKLLGAGYYSTAHQPRNNPFEIYKASKRPFNYDNLSLYPVDNDIDPYYDWVKAIAPYVKSNPYLPRVYVSHY